MLPPAERVSGQRRYRPEVLHRLSIVDLAQRAGLTLEEIAPLTGPDCADVDVCGLFAEPTLLAPARSLDVYQTSPSRQSQTSAPDRSSGIATGST